MGATGSRTKRASHVPAVAMDRIEEVRRFNRFYTREIGVLDRSHLHSEFSLVAVRLLYELAHWDDVPRDPATATDIGRDLLLDAGYLSRLLRDLEIGRASWRERV